jgi:phosphate:Na+ symporter
MGFMSSALDSLIEISWVANSLLLLGEHIWIGVIGGMIFTAVTQSSSAVTSLVIAMGLSQVITLEGAIGIILGANIGTCITGLVASLRMSPTARQASLAQIVINVVGVAMFLPFLTPFTGLVQKTSSVLSHQIANAHTIFNVAVSVILLPFVKPIAKFVNWVSPIKPGKEKKRVTVFIDEGQFAVPSVAINEASKELYRLGSITAEMVTLSCEALLEKDEEKANRVLVMEDTVVDPVTDELETFVNKLMRADLSHAQQRRSFQIKNLLVDVERVGDMAEDIAQFAQDRAMTEIPFTDQAVQDFETLWHNALSTYTLSLQALQEKDPQLAERVCEVESEFDAMYLEARQRHIERLECGKCHPKADVIFTEALRLLERISDHADNVGVSILRN